MCLIFKYKNKFTSYELISVINVLTGKQHIFLQELNYTVRYTI